MSFFPAFFDLSSLSIIDTGIILAIAIAVSGVKLGYAYMGNKASLLLTSTISQGINLTAGSVAIATGIVLIVKS